MLKQPTPVLKSVLTEYANTPTAFISVKAVRNAHWVLALLGVGAFATEACELSYIRRCSTLTIH